MIERFDVILSRRLRRLTQIFFGHYLKKINLRKSAQIKQNVFEFLISENLRNLRQKKENAFEFLISDPDNYRDCGK